MQIVEVISMQLSKKAENIKALREGAMSSINSGIVRSRQRTDLALAEMNYVDNSSLVVMTEALTRVVEKALLLCVIVVAAAVAELAQKVLLLLGQALWYLDHDREA